MNVGICTIRDSITFEVSVKHGHRTENESLYSFETFISEIERIVGITDKDVTLKEVSIVIARFHEEMSGVFKRWQVIRSIICEENLFSFDISE